MIDSKFVFAFWVFSFCGRLDCFVCNYFSVSFVFIAIGAYNTEILGFKHEVRIYRLWGNVLNMGAKS